MAYGKKKASEQDQRLANKKVLVSRRKTCLFNLTQVKREDSNFKNNSGKLYRDKKAYKD